MLTHALQPIHQLKIGEMAELVLCHLKNFHHFEKPISVGNLPFVQLASASSRSRTDTMSAGLWLVEKT